MAVTFPLFELLPEAERTAELQKLKACHFSPGDSVHERGAMSDVYFLFSGKVRIGIDEADGETAFFRYRVPGDMLGFYSAISGKVQPLRAMAIEETRAGRMPAPDFMNMVLGNRALSECMLRLLAGIAVAETNHIRQLILLGAAPRVVVELMNCAAAAGGNIFEIPSRTEMASRLGMRSETLIRHLSDLQKRGLIALDGRLVKILDAKQLSELVE
jgi:CRP-like cAMP-binding protein